jgi:hypothetical protein
MNRYLPIICAAALLLTGCARVYVRPAFDLKPHEAIGIVDVKCTSGNLTDVTTEKLIESMSEDQIGIQTVELGDESQLLSDVRLDSFGPDAYKAIGAKYDVGSVLLSQLTVSSVKPSFHIGPHLGTATMSAKVTAILTATLVQTSDGATIWTKSGKAERKVGGVTKAGGVYSFQAEDPDAAYGDLGLTLAHQVTRDFRHSWKCWCFGH